MRQPAPLCATSATQILDIVTYFAMSRHNEWVTCQEQSHNTGGKARPGLSRAGTGTKSDEKQVIPLLVVIAVLVEGSPGGTASCNEVNVRLAVARL